MLRTCRNRLFLVVAGILASGLLLSGCLFGGENDTAVNSGVQPGLYRLDYTPHLPIYGASPDIFGVDTYLYLDAGGQYRLFLMDTLYFGPVPLIVYAGQWSSNASALVQASRLYGESFPESYDYSSPGIFYYEPLLPDSAPIRNFIPASFQRYEDDFISRANLWMTYRKVAPYSPIAGTFALLDTVLDENYQPLPRREEWVLAAGGGFRVRDYYDGMLLVETVSDGWLQPGSFVFAVNPRRRFYDAAGVPGAWDTLFGDWTLSLRKVGAHSFEKLDVVYSWYDEYRWVTYNRTAAAAKVSATDQAPEFGPPPATPRHPAGFDPAARPWSRIAFPRANVAGTRTSFPGRTSLRSSRAGELPPTAPSR
jgi:hypothetical protein